MTSSIDTRWQTAAALVARTRDVIDDRPTTDHAGVQGRGWDTFLRALDDVTLRRIEAEGLDAQWPADTPPSLRALVTEARHVCTIAPVTTSVATPVATTRHVAARKQAQIAAFADVVLPLARTAARIVDVGSGHGHFTRAVALRTGLPTLGLERDEAFAARARVLAAGSSSSFAVTDVLRDGLPFAAGDCVIALHACGALSDAIVEAAASTTAVALVGCCLQKRTEEARLPLCAGDGTFGAALVLPKRLLGLSNLTARAVGVEASLAENVAARERRVALHALLAARGVVGEPGTEIAGLNRRAAHGSLWALVERAFALRGLSLPSAHDIDAAAVAARASHGQQRRLALPRTMLARALEVFLLFDRARHLTARGFYVDVGALFPPVVSARNLVLVARR